MSFDRLFSKPRPFGIELRDDAVDDFRDTEPCTFWLDSTPPPPGEARVADAPAWPTVAPTMAGC